MIDLSFTIVFLHQTFVLYSNYAQVALVHVTQAIRKHLVNEIPGTDPGRWMG